MIDGRVGFVGGMNLAERYMRGFSWGIWNDIKRIDFYSQSRPDYPEADVIFDYILKERDYAGLLLLIVFPQYIVTEQ